MILANAELILPDRVMRGAVHIEDGLIARITEGAEEIQMRKVAAFLFGFMGPRKAALAEAGA